MTNSGRSLRQRCLRADRLNRLATATNTTAANTGWGNALSSCEKKSSTTRMTTAAMAPDSGVRAPPPSLTTDCDMPPLTGKPWPNPAARLEAASARNSWLASSRRVVLGREHAADGGRLDRCRAGSTRRPAAASRSGRPNEPRGGRGPASLAALRRATSPRARRGREGAKPRCRRPRRTTPWVSS